MDFWVLKGTVKWRVLYSRTKMVRSHDAAIFKAVRLPAYKGSRKFGAEGARATEHEFLGKRGTVAQGEVNSNLLGFT